MSRVQRLLERLRSAGVIIRAQDSRLVIEAPAGVITPDLRDVLVRNKANLLSVLGRQQKGGSGDAIDHAVRGVAELLARAYERLNTAPPGGTHEADRPPDPRLANSATPSVHGVVRQDP